MKYRVWNIVNPPSPARYHDVETPAAGAALINTVAAQQLRDSRIGSNAFGLETMVDGEWEEWYNEDGDDVDAAFAYLLDTPQGGTEQ